MNFHLVGIPPPIFPSLPTISRQLLQGEVYESRS